MPGLLSGKTLRRGGSGQFIDLKGAQPQLPPTPSTSTGFTIITSDTLVTSYASSLGNIQFASGQMYSNVTTTNLQLIGTETTSVIISGGTVSTSTNTGALVVQGGIGVWGDVNVGGQTNLSNLFAQQFTATTATIITLHVTGTNISYSSTTGALVVDGGTGIGGNLYVQGTTVLTAVTATLLTATIATLVQAVVTNENDSNNTSTGALVVAGGVGIGRNLNVETTLHVGSTATFATDLTVIRDAEFRGKVTVDGQGEVDISPRAASVYIRPILGGSIIIQPNVPGSIDAMVIGQSVPEDGYFNVVHTTTVDAAGSVYSQDGIAAENRLLYTPRSTVSVGVPPVAPRIGDFWIDPSQGATFQYVNDDGTKLWLQFTGL